MYFYGEILETINIEAGDHDCCRCQEVWIDYIEIRRRHIGTPKYRVMGICQGCYNKTVNNEENNRYSDIAIFSIKIE